MRFLLIAILISLAAPAAAQAPSHVPLQEGQTLLHLGESAQRALRQDRLTIQLRAEVTGPDATRVQADINRRMIAALDRARAVPAVRTDIRGYWVNQERPQNAPVRWRGVQMMTLTGADSGALLALAGELQQGGLVMSGMNYDLAPETTRAAEDELTAEALQRLRDRANRVAAAMGLAVRSFRDVRVGNVGGDRPPRPMLMRAEAMAATAMPPPVAEPGETNVQVTVEADVVLGPVGRP